MRAIPGGFIKANRAFVWDYQQTDLAPLFRCVFTVGEFKHAEIAVAALGMGVFFLNGKKITEDRFISPTSDYRKTVWYNRYDVSSLLKSGKNVLACILGNGWYNESLKSCWEFREAPWRDNPKFSLCLTADGIEVARSDDTWRCMPESWITFNQLRSGEHVDLRKYIPGWNELEFDDSAWEFAVQDDTPPTGILRESICPPVRECAVYPALSVKQTGEKRYLFDLGQNMSGYIRLRVKQKAGDVLTIRYGEQFDEHGERKGNGMEAFYPDSPFQTDILTLAEGENVFSPLFTYHGFHKVEITGLDHADASMVDGIFTHSDVPQIGKFECSNQDLNDLFRIGVMACWSNMQYMLTDCPTREKYGWLNDARASAEHLLMNFDIGDFFRKWYRDILDSLREDGAVPGIAPTSGCLFDSFTGPICSCAIHEIAYKMYLYTGDDSLLKEGLPAMLSHLNYLKNKEDGDGLIAYGLYDWAGPFGSDYQAGAPTPLKFTDSALYIEFMQRTIFAARKAGNADAAARVEKDLVRVKRAFLNAYLLPNGRCAVHEQTAVSMMIGLGLYNELAPLAEQLKECVQAHNFHMHCGMLGVRFLYDALNTCGLSEYAYRIIAAEGFPSYTQWLRQGATTLWETFYEGASKNHHMYSGFMLFLMNTLGGIQPVSEKPGMRHIDIRPFFAEELTYCSVSRAMATGGALEVSWRREADIVRVKLHIPNGLVCTYRGVPLLPGDTEFVER